MVLKNMVAENFFRTHTYTLQIDLTSHCNTRCKKCVAINMNRTCQEDMNNNIIKDCLDTFNKLCDKKKYIILNCNSEPTIANGFIYALKYIDENFHDITVYYDTNAINLADEIIDTLINIKNVNIRINISCWAYDVESFKEWHDVVNPEKQFDNYDKNIDKYIALNNVNNIRIGFTSPYISRDFKNRIISYLYNKHNNIQAVYDGLDNCDNNIPLMFRIYYDNGIGYYGSDIIHTERDKTLIGKNCWILGNTINITNSGNVYLCVPVNQLSDTSLGNVYNESLKNILLSNKKCAGIIQMSENGFPYDRCNDCTAIHCNSKFVKDRYMYGLV